MWGYNDHGAILPIWHLHQTIEEQRAYTDLLRELVDNHTDTVHILALGAKECRRYLSTEQMNEFLNRTLRSDGWLMSDARFGIDCRTSFAKRPCTLVCVEICFGAIIQQRRGEEGKLTIFH